MMLTGENRSTRRKSIASPTWLSKSPHVLAEIEPGPPRWEAGE